MKFSNVELPIEIAARLTEFTKSLETLREFAAEYSAKYPALSEVLLKIK
jgi:hypothetical protein